MKIGIPTALSKGVWAISPEVAFVYGSFVSSLLAGENVQMDVIAESPYTTVASDSSGTQKRVRVIPIKGPLTKETQMCGPIGMAEIGNQIMRADSSFDIDAILLDIDTPGGTVDGTIALAEVIRNTKKPIVAFVNGMAASAGMWIASAADKIIASTNFDSVGSIGVMTSFLDMQPMWEAAGVKFHTLLADQSSDKNKMFDEIRAGKYTDYIKERLNPLADAFRTFIRENRPNITDDMLSGKVYHAKDVIGSLVDSIGSFDAAIESTISIFPKSFSNQNNQAMSNFQFQTEEDARNWFQKMFGLKPQKEVAAEQLEQLKADRFIQDSEIAHLTKQLAEAEADKTAMQQEIYMLEQNIAALKSQPGAQTAVATKATDGYVASPTVIDLPEGSFADQFAAFKTVLDNARK